MARRATTSPRPDPGPLAPVLLGAHVAMLVLASARMGELRTGAVPWLDAGLGLALAGGFLWGLQPVWDGRDAQIPRLFPATIVAYYASLAALFGFGAPLVGWAVAAIAVTLGGVLVAQSFNDLGAAAGEAAPLALKLGAGAATGLFLFAIAQALHGVMVGVAFPLLTALFHKLIRESGEPEPAASGQAR